MRNQNPYDYKHDSVRKFFEQKNQQEMTCLNNRFNRYLESRVIEEWLNDYTTLLNLWFCELLYYPTKTNNESWGVKLLEKIQSAKYMGISEIINHFNLKTIRLNNLELYIEEALKRHLSLYIEFHNYYPGATILEQTLGGARGQLTFSIFKEIRKDNGNNLKEILKKLYPRDESLPFNEGYAKSYHPILRDEEDREWRIINMLSEYDGDAIRPLLIRMGYVPED